VHFYRTTNFLSLLIGYRIERFEDLSVLHVIVVRQKYTNEIPLLDRRLPLSSMKSFMSLTSHILANAMQILRNLGGSSSRNPGLHEIPGDPARTSPERTAIVVTDTRIIRVELIIFGL